MRIRHAALPVILALIAASAPAADDAAKKLKSKEVGDRLEAVELLRVNGGKDAAKLLAEALKDKDWEVREWAAKALREQGGPDQVDALIQTSLVGPVRRVRLAAVDAVLALDATAATDEWRQRVSGKLALPAAEALAQAATWPGQLAPAARESLLAGIERGLAADEQPVRRLVARGITAFPPAEVAERLTKLLDHDDEDVAVIAAVVDAIRDHPAPGHLSALLSGLMRTARTGTPEPITDVVERRLDGAIRAVVGIAGDDAEAAAQPVSDALDAAKTPAVATRIARLIGVLGAVRTRAPQRDEKEAVVIPGVVPPAWAVARLDRALKHDDPAVRAAAAHGLGLVGTPEALDRATASCKADPSPRVRMHALRAVVKRRPAPDESTVRVAADRLEYDEDARVREEAAVALGARGAEGGVGVLEKALGDPDPWVRVCAAVSLGKTRSESALGALRRTRAKAKDWKLRGAAVVGLGRLQHVEAVADLIDALGDKQPAIRRTAFEFLRRMTAQEIPPQPKAWAEWWAGAHDGYVFVDREEEARKAEKFGYAPDASGVYEGQDVIVLQSRGDTIENLLDRLGIDHRMTRQAAVSDAGLHPFGVFVSNCTGEVTDDDVEQLQWFVRVGGYVFCSCWALHYTAERIYPGAIRKLEVKAEILDNVLAEPCEPDSPYLEGVFDGVTRPIYVLYGSHLIEVLDPERVEVLIDSPDCASRWGGGNLAAWFDAGHGIVLDSANHFDLQGLERAEGLKSADDRRAYAMDHMGLDYAELRELDEQRVWKSGSKAAAAARDLSAFRFITNFVRAKRRTDP